MLTGSAIDTILNLLTFVFIGACVWLILRPLPNRKDSKRD